jgi:hypothetical protein
MAMIIRNTLTVVLLLFVAISLGVAVAKIVRHGRQPIAISETQSTEGENKASSDDPPMRDCVIVYYFHSNTRCESCRKVEAYGQDAVKDGFADKLKSGGIAWHAVNYETPGNEHYVVDYQLVAPNLVLAIFKDGKQVNWAALKEVVDEVGDKTTFTNLLQRRLREFIKTSGQTP